MDKGEVIRKLKAKMKVQCAKCFLTGKKQEVDYCFEKCSVHILTNHMLQELKVL